MTNSLFDYELPDRLIAQHPALDRDSSRLMAIRRDRKEITHRHFRDLPELLNPGDLLVLNDTRVLPARLIGHREKTGGKWEGLFLRETSDGLWELLGQSGGKPSIGETLAIEPGPLKLKLCDRQEGLWLMQPWPPGPASELLAKHGRIPLPPYIRKGRGEEADRSRYQTVYARADGSVAAPTAGLHFTPELFENLRERGILSSTVTLHVGLGTFEPIRSDDPAKHAMHHEWAEVPQRTVDAIRECKERGNRTIAVGTTATRALETAAKNGELQEWRGETNLFIQPPYEFKVINGLITNFHLPRTTLLYLVGAFAGMELLHSAYEIAIAEEYRFYSYGDAMIVL